MVANCQSLIEVIRQLANAASSLSIKVLLRAFHKFPRSLCKNRHFEPRARNLVPISE